MKTKRNTTAILAAIATAMLIQGSAVAYVTNVYEFEGQTTNLSIQPCSNDLAQTDSISNYFEGGDFYLAAWPSCRMYMLFNASNSYHGYGPGAVGGGENMYDAGVLFQDYTVCTVRTDFASAKTVTQIVIYAGHGCAGQGSSRSWINCDIEFSADGSSFTFFKNMKTGKIGDFISSYGDGFSNVMARLCDTEGTYLANNVMSVRYIFYPVGWDGEFRPPATAAESTVCREIDVYGEDFITPAPPVAMFSASPTNGTAPFTVSFTDESTNSPMYWHWQFGDSETSTDRNPLHEYNSTGVFTVTLICTNSLGSSTNTKPDYITATLPPLPTAGFCPNIFNGACPLDVAFTDESVYADSHFYDFDDGTGTTFRDPRHRFNTTGEFTVLQIVNNLAGSDTNQATITVTGAPPEIVCAYEFNTDTGALMYQPTDADMLQGAFCSTGYFAFGGYHYLQAGQPFDRLRDSSGPGNYGVGSGIDPNGGQGQQLLSDLNTPFTETDPSAVCVFKFTDWMAISNISVYGGWHSNRQWLHFYVGISSDGGDTYTDIYHAATGVPSTNMPPATPVVDTGSTPLYLAANVARADGMPLGYGNALRLTFYGVGNPSIGWFFVDATDGLPPDATYGSCCREIDVFGAVPEPACVLVAVLGAALLRRR